MMDTSTQAEVVASPRVSSPLPPIKSKNSQHLPTLLKSIHGRGVKYFYLSGDKRYDQSFWNPKLNQDLDKWYTHRKRVEKRNIEWS